MDAPIKGNYVVEMEDQKGGEKMVDDYDPYEHREIEHPTTWVF